MSGKAFTDERPITAAAVNTVPADCSRVLKAVLEAR
jgi:hypothetical protein